MLRVDLSSGRVEVKRTESVVDVRRLGGHAANLP